MDFGSARPHRGQPSEQGTEEAEVIPSEPCMAHRLCVVGLAPAPNWKIAKAIDGGHTGVEDIITTTTSFMTTAVSLLRKTE